jgi:two-component system, LytTR family, response regulator
MNRIKCIAIDDEPLALEVIKDHAEKIPFLEMEGYYTDPMEAYTSLAKVDLIFLDIEMPAITGIEWLKTIRPNARVILTTAYPDYALESYDLEVLDYLIKPISFERFLRGVNKYLQYSEKPAPLKTEGIAPEVKTFMFVKSERKTIKVEFEDILYIQGLKDYIIIYTTKGEKIFSLLNLKKLADELPESQFVRIHKSFIVPLGKIEEINHQKVHIGKHILPIGSVYQELFNILLNKYKIE